MQKPKDELLIAYLDGELDAAAEAEMAALLERDPALREMAHHLAESAAAVRAAFDEVLHEAVPEHLLAVARSGNAASASAVNNGKASAQIVRFPAERVRKATDALTHWRSWLNVAAAASIASLVVGGGLGFVVGTSNPFGQGSETPANVANANWIDNIAGYHKMLVNAGPNDLGLVDVPADPQSDAARKVAQQLPSDFHIPNLKPWGLDFQGARLLFIDGKPATQLFYTTDDKALGPLTVVVAATSLPDSSPQFDRRDELNILYWRHQGHAYALVGSANIGYLWNIHNDLAYQFDAI